MTKCSLIIATYNWPRALDLSLQSVLRQTRLPDEVVIADDGSGEETTRLIQKYQETFPVPLVHIWQEDRGFQLSKIRNKSVAAARYDYILQIDGDIIMDPRFVKDHLDIARKNYLVRGSRAMLDEKTTNFILSQSKIPPFSFLRKKCTHKSNSMRSLFLSELLRNIYKINGKQRYIVKGCNMAFWRDEFINVNGYNENIMGWGYEDVELCARMLKSGVKKQSLKFRGTAYHLYHPFFSRDSHQSNRSILKQTIQSDNHRCEKGISQYLQ